MHCRNSTVGDVYRKVMGDAPMAYAETVGGVRVSEDDPIAVGKNDVSRDTFRHSWLLLTSSRFSLSRLGVHEMSQPALCV